jgi:hypothetical protein
MHIDLSTEIETENNLQYQFSPVTSGKLHFKVRAPNDAQVALATGPSEAEPMQEVSYMIAYMRTLHDSWI